MLAFYLALVPFLSTYPTSVFVCRSVDLYISPCRSLGQTIYIISIIYRKSLWFLAANLHVSVDFRSGLCLCVELESCSNCYVIHLWIVDSHGWGLLVVYLNLYFS
jgi:hypothetical protein